LSQVQSNPLISWAGAYHSSEIPMVFNLPNGTYRIFERGTPIFWTEQEEVIQSKIF
jgi:hypothetical protein